MRARCKSIILLIALYGCKTWSLSLTDERRLRVFENRILKQIFPSKRNENEDWRKLHNEEYSSLYRSPNKVMVNKSRRLRFTMEEGKNAFKTLTKPSEELSKKD